MRIYVERTLFFCNRWNQIDFIIVGFGWLDFALADTLSISLLRMSRLIRVARAVRLLISIPEFYLLINGLYSSIKAILFGALLLVSVIVIWAVVSVQLLHPITSRQSYPMCQRWMLGLKVVCQKIPEPYDKDSLFHAQSWGRRREDVHTYILYGTNEYTYPCVYTYLYIHAFLKPLPG